VVHDLSISSTRFDHMSPVAIGLAALLHASIALALLATPFREAQQALDAIEITMEPEPTPPPPVEAPPKPPEPPPVAAAQPPPPPPPPQPTVQEQLPTPSSVPSSVPKGTTMDPRAAMATRKVGAAEPEPTAQAPAGQDPTQTQEAKEEPKPEPPKEVVKDDPPSETVKKSEPVQQPQEMAKSEPVQEQQMAALAPQPPPPAPPPPRLEDALPPVEAPPSPLTAREIPVPKPPPAPPPPKLEDALPPIEAPSPPLTLREIPALPPPPPPPPKPQPAPPQAAPKPQALPPPAPHVSPPQQQLAHSPLNRPTQPQQPGPGDTRQASRAPPSSFVNPADVYGQRKVEESYQALIMRQVQQRSVYSRANSEEGQVVALVTVSRDGRLIDARVDRSSGYRNLDNAALDALRQAGPYPPLPGDIPGDRHTFVVLMNYRRNNM
jgi:protein TonB